MSAAMGSTAKIYVHLLDEGTTVIRPAQGEQLAGNLFRLLATPDYDPADEHWQFPPGSIVRCITEKWGGDEVLVATRTLELSEKWAAVLVRQPETGMGYQVTTVMLKDGRQFRNVTIVGGIVSDVAGHTDIPFKEEEIADIVVTHAE